MTSSSIADTLFTYINRRHTQEPEDEKSLHEMLVFESMKDGDSQVRIRLPGIPITTRPKLMTVDKKGKFVEAPQPPANGVGVPSGFVLGGDIKLFGMGLPARLYTFHGELAKASGIREMVTIGERILLKELLNGLSGTSFGDVQLQNPSFTYQEVEPKSEKTPGLHFKADVSFEGALAGIRDTLKTIFGLNEYMSLRVSGFVASTREWTKPLTPPEMSLSGTILGVKAKMGGLLTFTSVGVELTAVRSAEKIHGRSSYHCMFGFFGTVDLKIPGSVVPLVMEYSMKEEEVGIHVLRLKKGTSDWLNVSGFKGLKLSSVQLITRIPVKEVLQEVSFEASASLQFSQITLNLSGVYSPSEFYIQTEIPECSIADIKRFYSDLTGRELEQFKHDIQLKNLTLRVATSGLSFSGQITIDGHSSIKATLKIHRDGISITGSLEDIKLGEVTVEKAELDVFIGRIEPNTTSRETGFEISGKVHFRDMVISVALYTTFEENQPIMWTVYGEIDADFRLNRLEPKVKGTFLDLSLRQVAFIVSNQDSPTGDFNVFKYPIRRGVQFCAVIDRIRQLDQVSGGRVGGLVLRAAYASARGFSFGIVLPAPVTFSLGPNLSSGPISLELVITKNPQLVFTAALNVKIAKQTQPLVFTFGLKADLDSAEGFGQMTNYWVNPLGIGKRVRIGPDVALEMGIIYAVLASTGTPSKVAFSGGLAIGGTEVQVAMAISENPLEQILKASLSKLSITDLVKFASDISGEEIPLPPEDLLAFRNVLFYISTGTSIGTTYYPAGASIKGDIQLFGQETNVECTIGSTTKISALFDEVQVGPLLLAGVEESRPSLSIELGLMKQHIMVDGRLKLFNLDTSVRSVFDILPKPDMRFDLSFAFAEALDIEISARVVGAAEFKNLKNADFLLGVILEQDILKYINNHVKAHFHAIQKALKEGFEATRKFFEAEKKRLNAHIIKAKKFLHAAEVAWEAKEREIRDALNKVVREFEEGILELERDLEEAKKALEAALYAAHQHLEQARIDRAAFITSAAIKVMRTRREFKAAIKAQLFDVRATKEETKSMFGVLLQDVKDAEKEYHEAQDTYEESVKDLEEAIKELEEAPFYSKIRHSLQVGHYKGFAQEAEADFLSASQKLATAQAALESSGYQSAVAVKTAKVMELQSAKREEEAVMKMVEQDLETETKKRNQKVEASRKAIEEQTAVTDQKAALEKAQKALKKFKTAKQETIGDLKGKLEALPQSPEFEKRESATKDLKVAKGAAKELEVAHEAVIGIEKEVAKSGPKLGDIAEKIVEALDNAFNIHRVELYGSLNDLVKKGQPLTARVQGVIAGIEVDFEIEYGIGKTLHFMRTLLWKLWDEVKLGIEDGLEADIEVEVKVAKAK